MKYIIIALLAALTLSACATAPEGSRSYVGRIECIEDLRLIFFETVHAVSDEDARGQINYRLNNWNLYHEAGTCHLATLTAQ